jgi:hypothetical protein
LFFVSFFFFIIIVLSLFLFLFFVLLYSISFSLFPSLIPAFSFLPSYFLSIFLLSIKYPPFVELAEKRLWTALLPPIEEMLTSICPSSAHITTFRISKVLKVSLKGQHHEKRRYGMPKETSTELEFLDMNYQKTRVFCSMLFTVLSTRGLYRKPNSTLVLKLHKKSAKQENTSLFMNSML